MAHFRAPDPPIEARPPKGTVLVIAPHPDDETLGPGGTLALHADQGDAIHAVFVFSGIQGDPDGWFPRDELPRIREREARAAGKILGIGELTFLGYPDNLSDADYDIFEGLPPDPDDKRRVLVAGLATRLGEFVDRIQPATVYFPWRGEINADHWGVGEAIEHLRTSRPGVDAASSWMGYEIWSACAPQTVVDVSDVIDRKLRAIRAYESQLRYRDYEPISRGLMSYRALLLESGATFGEAFTGRYGRAP